MTDDDTTVDDVCHAVELWSRHGLQIAVVSMMIGVFFVGRQAFAVRALYLAARAHRGG